MSSLSISEGSRALTGDLTDAAALDLLIDRRLKFSDSTKGKIKLRTIGQSICRAEGGAIDAIRRLASKGLLCIDDSEVALSEGVLLEVTEIRLSVVCRQAEQPSLDGTEDDPERTFIPPVVRDPRKLPPYTDEVTDSDGTIYAGRVTPVFASELSESVISCSIEIRRKLPDEEEHTVLVERQDFDTLADAWDYFDELTGTGSVLAWASRQILASDADFIGVDELTLDALATALGVHLGGDRLNVKTKVGEKVFVAGPEGKRCPFVVADKKGRKGRKEREAASV